MKYNSRLRDPKNTSGYVTTIHVVVSGIIKTSGVMEVPPNRKVWRGLGGRLLPASFAQENEYGNRSGVEAALMSTTTNPEVATQYSGLNDGKWATALEIDVGQVDNGAPLYWLSQYAKELEILFPPLSNLEVIAHTLSDTDRHTKKNISPHYSFNL